MRLSNPLHILIASPILLGMDDITELAEHLGSLLLDRGFLLTAAESCTGGGISAAITSVAGSSGWFNVGYVTYSNQAKTGLLGVSLALIGQCGAVSEPVVEAMARGALASSGADLAVAVSGIAGPGGAVPGKPVGTVCFGWGSQDRILSRTWHFTGDRTAVRRQTVIKALSLLIAFLEEAD